MKENDDLFDTISDKEDASLLGIPEELIDILKDNSIQTTLNDKDFYIISVESIKYECRKKMNIELSWDSLERLCDVFIGNGQWGIDDEWSVCDSCYKPIYLNDYYEQDYWYPEDGGIICGDCVRANPEEYLKELEGTTNIARLVDDTVLEDNGYELDTEFSRDLSYSERLSKLEYNRMYYPNDKFIFGVDRWGDVSLYKKEGDNNEEE